MAQQYPVTILLSIFNHGSSLDACFESLEKQTFQSFKIVCIDDSSTDDTSLVIQKWENIFGTERFLHLRNAQNEGLTKSLNIGLAAIDTAYTSRIDADDTWKSDKLEKQLQFVENNVGYGIVGCQYKKKNSHSISIFPETDSEIRTFFAKRNPFAHSCVMFRTDIIRKIGGYDEGLRFGQDYDLWFRCYNLTKFYNLPQVLCERNIDKKSYDKLKAHFLSNLKIRMKYTKALNLPKTNYLRVFADALLFLSIISLRRLQDVLK